MKRFIKYSLALVAVGFSIGGAQAGGIQVPEQGTKAIGMGNAFTAVADDASAIWFNPAGIAFQDGMVVTLGTDFIIPNTEYTPPAGGAISSPKSEVFVVPHAYISYNNPNLPVVLGLGINSPFGLKTDWSGASVPFDLAGKVTLSQVELLNFNPTIAYKINENLSVGAGFSYYSLVKFNFDNALLTQHMKTGDGWGGNVGLLYKGEKFNFGATYRSRVKLDASGTATGIGALAAFGSTSVNTAATLPDMVSGGIAFKPDDKWLLSANVDWVNWKTLDKLVFTRGKTLGPLGTASTSPFNWKATTAFRLGAQWSYNPNMRARFGYVYDPTPINDADFSPRIPGADRQLITVGYGYDFNMSTTLDLAYAYVLLSDRSQTASAGTRAARNGQYKSDVHLAMLSATFRF
ncbi:MAG: outer membrane protein transport protein [Mariprofundaceae bacterium]|nr:outer membrane protein transport protein [Mariprofundaceae bacterium]